MINLLSPNLLKRPRASGLLGLTLEGSRLEGVVLRRSNGAVQVEQSFAVTLSLDPLTNDLELVGREIRNHLDAAGVRERSCVVGVPLKWALTLQIPLPEMPEEDVGSFLQIEAERGFPCDPATLQVAASRSRSPAGHQRATLVGIPRNHLERLAQALRAARLKPVSFSLGLTALQAPDVAPANGVLALVIGETHVGLQVTAGGGVTALRALEGALEVESGRRILHADVVAREVRITLGQLPEELRLAVGRVRIFGPRDLARELADELELRSESMAIQVEVVAGYAPGEFGVQLPPAVTVSSGFSLAAARLAGRGTPLEFLPPRVTAWHQFAARYSTGRFRRVGILAGAVALVVAACFLYQEWHLLRLRSQWSRIGPKARALDGLQQQIRQFRPWFDDSLRSLSILRQLTEAFPEDGAVSAKTIEIRNLNTVTCSGTARENQVLLRTLEKLRGAPRVADLKVDVIRGKSPMQFTFDFRWNEGGNSAN